MSRLLFAGRPNAPTRRGPTARTLRAVGRSAAAGAVGGLLFTVVMVQIGFLGTVARLVGSTSAGVGAAVHLGIALLVGACHGLLFRRQTTTFASAAGSDTAYGFLWWVLGTLTLMPVWLGVTRSGPHRPPPRRSPAIVLLRLVGRFAAPWAGW